jgi:photoactive yellow protein
MNAVVILEFYQADILAALEAESDEGIDALEFGVIGFGADTVVRRYNAFESRCAGLTRERVVGHPLFSVVAQCMNNFLVAQRFEDAAVDGTPLDATLDYVLTLRMRPVKVKLRLLSHPARALRYVLVNRST